MLILLHFLIVQGKGGTTVLNAGGHWFPHLQYRGATNSRWGVKINHCSKKVAKGQNVKVVGFVVLKVPVLSNTVMS